jgi:predicted HTH domain antitoxin
VFEYDRKAQVMLPTVSIQIPRDVLQATKMTPDELKRELAVCLYQLGKLSFGKARELAAMTPWTFQQLLGSRMIPVHYGLEDYEQDLTALRKLEHP